MENTPFNCKILSVCLRTVLLSLLLLPHLARGNPANPNPIEVTQPDGSRITIQLRGDEWFNWREDSAGCTVVKDAAGRFVYAQLDADQKLVPTPFVVGKIDPLTVGISQRILPDKDAIKRIIEERKNRHLDPAFQLKAFQLGQQFEAASAQRGKSLFQPPLPGFGSPEASTSEERPARGGKIRLKVLVLLAVFSDHYDSNDPNFITNFTRLPSEYDVLFNSVNPDPLLAPTGSVRDNILYNSNGNAEVDFVIYPSWIKLDKPEAYYAGPSGTGDNAEEMVMESLIRVAHLIDFGLFDHLTVVHSGYDAASGAIPAIWSHMNPNFTVGPWPYDRYMTVPGLWDVVGTDMPRIGVYVHELGHLLFGLPDLYDLDGGEGIGNWGMMGAGSWGFDGTQLHPSNFSPWSRMNIIDTRLDADPDVDIDWDAPFVINPEGEDPNWGLFDIPVWDEFVNSFDTRPTVYQVNLKSDGLLVNDFPDAGALVGRIAGEDVIVSEATLTGNALASGIFKQGLEAGLDFEAGIILSTGNIYDAPGYNRSNIMTTEFLEPGDDDLGLALAGTPDGPPIPTADAVVLTFTLQAGDPEIDTGFISLNVIFASEEMHNALDDLSGPAIDAFTVFVDGTVFDGEGLLVTPLPNPIGIPPDVLNPFTNPALGLEPTADLEYNGFTNGFTLTIMLGPNAGTEDYTPGEPHTVKIVIADVEDGITEEFPPQLDGFWKDSAVFIQSESLSFEPKALGEDLPQPIGSEYLLIENRQQVGYETVLPQGGLAIWHIEEFAPINTQEGHPQQADWSRNGNHYHIALLQADGDYDLELGNNRGDAGDIYHGDINGVNFINRCSLPSTNVYQEGFVGPTHIAITDIPLPQPVMDFHIFDRAYTNDDCWNATALENENADPNSQSMEVTGTTICGLDSFDKATGRHDPIRRSHAARCVGNVLSDPYDPNFPFGDPIDPIDAWHSYKATKTGFVKVIMESDFDTTLETFQDCNDLRDQVDSIVCSDDTEFNPAVQFYQAEILQCLNEGQDYLFRVGGYNNETGNYSLKISDDVPAPGNDDCESAIPLIHGVPYNGNTAGAGGDDITAEGADDRLDVWHSFTPSVDGQITITVTLCGTEADFDTTLAVFDDCNQVLQNQLGFNDDCTDDPLNVCNTCESVLSKLTMDVKAGNTYLIRVAGNNKNWGKYWIELLMAPDNDRCENALSLADSNLYLNRSYSGTTVGATATDSVGPLVTENGGGDDTLDVWYTYTPTVSEDVTISLCGSTFDTTLGVFEFCGDIEIGSNNDYLACGQQSQLTLPLNADQTYFIRVAGWGASTGDYTLTVTGGQGTDLRIEKPFDLVGHLNFAMDTCLEATGGNAPYSFGLFTDAEYTQQDQGSLPFATGGVAQTWKADNQLWDYTLPFAFPYYGGDVTAIKVCSNGFLDLGGGVTTSPNNSPVILEASKRIAPLWDNLRTDENPTDDIYIDESVNGQVTIRWQGTVFGSGNPVNVSVTLFDDGRIQFDYGSGNVDVSPTVAISNGTTDSVVTVPGYDSYDALVSLGAANSILLTPPVLQPQLPPGVTLLPDGCLTGAPTTTGQYDAMIRVRDSLIPNAAEVVQAITITVDILGDLFVDGHVNLFDISWFANHWMRTDCSAANNYCEGSDVNHDCEVDIQDLQEISQNWLFWAP